MAAKDKADLHQRAKESTDELAQEQYALRESIYRDSYDPTKTSLSTAAAGYVRTACHAFSLQAWTEAMAQTIYRDADGEEEHLGNTEPHDDDEDDESNFVPETQYVPAGWDICEELAKEDYPSDYSDDCRVEELGEMSAPGYLTDAHETPTEATSSVIEDQLPVNTSRSTVSTTPSPKSLPGINPDKEASSAGHVPPSSRLDDNQHAESTAKSSPTLLQEESSPDSLPECKHSRSAEAASQTGGSGPKSELPKGAHAGNHQISCHRGSSPDGKRKRFDDEDLFCDTIRKRGRLV